MDEVELIEYKDVDLSNSMLMVAFPTVGLISSIAGHFVVDSLKLDEMFPGIKIDPEPLYKEAKDIEEKIRSFMAQSKPTAPSLPPIPSQMYG